MRNERKEIVFASIITVIMAIMNISGLPATLFIHIELLDVQPFYFSLMINFIFIASVFFAGWKMLYPKWDFGLGTRGLLTGIKNYGLSGLIIFIASTFAFLVGLLPFTYKPTVAKVLIEGFIYYVGVAVIEELYSRGLLLNILEKLFSNKKNASVYAIVISSIVFGVGHIFGALGSSPLTIICKTLWTIGLGLYLGAIYKITKNLWVAVILHAVIDFCSFPFCFSTTPPYPEISLWLLLVVYIMVSGYAMYLIRRKQTK